MVQRAAMKSRLNRAIASTGFCSRRKADEFISSGRVRVNGRVVEDFNFEIDADLDELKIDGRKVSAKHLDYILLYKPPGIVTTCKDEFDRNTVLDLLPPELRHVRPVGRLDRDSEGLLILTNDGALAQKLTHPSHQLFKRYQITVKGAIESQALEKLAGGVQLEDGVTLPAKVRLMRKSREKSTFEISIREGRNRQLRRMCAQIGYPVEHLVRVAIGALQLRQMQPGEWRRLTFDEIGRLDSDL
jgi:pseudouridine synthase